MERWEPIWRLGPGGGVYVTPQYSFGVDAMLLSQFAAPRGQTKICELGTGCGIIPLLWCGGHPWMRRRPLEVTAVEVQSAAAALATRSIARNGLSEKIRVLCADWRQLEDKLAAGSFERVVCNPPYFSAGAGKVSEDEARRIARHEESPEALQEVCNVAARLLQNGGTFCLCHLPSRLCDVLTALRAAGLEPKRLQLVQQAGDATPFLLLCEAKKGGKPGMQTEPTMILRNGDSYTEEARRLYGIRG